MSDFKDIIAAGLEDYGQLFVRILKEELIKAKKDATGRLIKSLRSEVREVVNGFELIIEGEDYLTYVDKGRKRGSFPPVREIKKWVSIRKIQARDKKGRFQSYEQTAWAVAKSIYRFGIKPTNVIDKSIKRLNAERDIIEEAYAEYLEQIIINNIKKLK